MKRIILFFAVCLGLSVSQTTFATDSETVRAATKRTSANTVTTNINSTSLRSYASEAKKTDTPQQKNMRTAAKPSQKVVSRTPKQTQNVKSRTTTNQTKQTTTNQNVTQRVATKSRNSVSNRTINSRKTTPAIISNVNATKRTGSAAQTRKNMSRAAELNAEKIESIKSANYSKCKTVYYECMDEFCANKDTNLRRCACSARIHEFDNIKKQLSDAEDKMLDFNQRLLTVSLDKEDAAAINVASEGELAFEKKDTSESEKLLQKITKTLNNSGDSKINNDLSAVSLSLDIDTAWDNLDSLSGVATSSKNGLDLYNAATPVCVEMAKEVCSDEELVIAQDGYKLTIQQDCNTVAKSYDTLYNNAMNKIHESSALLDMARLNIYQQRNSDDTLTCKKKILEQLSDASVCGTNLYKCLDVTGQYIDPSNGTAFLSENLYNLSNLIQEPTNGERWSKITKNESFVNFLKSKKKFLEPAIKQCQDIASTVWDEFLDDALSQIKLAQNAKLEEIRKSCTTLVTECKTSALTDLSEFDARALSIFSVVADKTANEMCSDVQKSCVALMNLSGIDDWDTGITGIATDITYNNIIDTCTQIGRDCIIQKCNGTSGNFALCKDITSDNRMALLKRNICWNEVYNCVKDADNLKNMNTLPIVANRDTYYTSLYSDSSLANVPVFCDNTSGTNKTACLITEQIWGNCENDPELGPVTINSRNKILQPDTGSTLLSWFALNTGTKDDNISCSAYGCPMNYAKGADGSCQWMISETTSDCRSATQRKQILNVILNTLTNYCESGKRDMFQNCCASGVVNNGICVADSGIHAYLLLNTTCNTSDNYYCPNYSETSPRQISLYCVTTDSSVTYDTGDAAYLCTNGKWILVDQYGNYFDFSGRTGAPEMSYNQRCNSCPCETPTKCTYANNGTSWSFGTCDDISTQVPTNNEFMVTYSN